MPRLTAVNRTRTSKATGRDLKPEALMREDLGPITLLRVLKLMCMGQEVNNHLQIKFRKREVIVVLIRDLTPINSLHRQYLQAFKVKRLRPI